MKKAYFDLTSILTIQLLGGSPAQLATWLSCLIFVPEKLKCGMWDINVGSVARNKNRFGND